MPRAVSEPALLLNDRNARANAIVALASIIPGYWCTVFTVEWMGRWKIQMMGFIMMTAFMGGLAGGFDSLINKHPNAADFMVLYCLTFFFANWGPNATTFVIPAECFPTSWRTTAHGISAAAGKAGAILGVFGFTYASQPKHANTTERGVSYNAFYGTGIGLQGALAILTATNGMGIFTTLLVPETKGKSLEEITGEVDAAKGSR